jgi:hypothetical protein
MLQGLSAGPPTAYRARPGGRPISRQTEPSGQKSIPARPLEGPSATGSAARPRAEAADGSPDGSMDGSGATAAPRDCAAFTPSARWLHPVPARGASAAPPWGQLSTASPPVAAGAVIAPRQTGRQRPAAQPRRARRPALGTDGQGRQARRRPGRRGPGSGSGPQPFRRRSARLIRAATMPGSRGAMMSSAASRSRPARTVRSDSPGWRTSVATDGNAAVPSGPRGWPSRRARTCTS